MGLETVHPTRIVKNGEWDFTSADFVRVPAPLADTDVATKLYVDNQIGANNDLSEILANGNITDGNDIIVSVGDKITTDTITETGAGTGVTIEGVLLKDTGITVVNAIDEFSTDITMADDSDTALPTEHAVKTYVDNNLWLMDPVDDTFDPTGGLPVDPSDGDRYIATATANGWTEDYIYEWDDSEGEWIEEVPIEGWMILMLAEMMFWFFFSGGWETVGYDTFLYLDGSNANSNIDIGAYDLITTGAVGRDTDNEINWNTDDQLDIVIGGVTSSIVSVSTGTGDNDKLVTQGYVDDAVATVDTWSEVLALGNTSGGTNVIVSAGDSLTTDTIDETTGDAGVTIDGLNIKNDGTTTTFLGTSGDYIRIGDASTTGHSLNSEDDLMVSGDFEVNGTTYLDSSVIVNSTFRMNDNKEMALGTGSDIILKYDTGQTVDTFLMALDNVSRSLLICEKVDKNTDFGHSAQTNPTIFLHSADATDTTQWISFAHDQTNGVIDVGTGSVSIPDGVIADVTGNLTGNADTVTNATLTTALTVNTGTLTLTADAGNDSVLTIGGGASSISGANTGDQTNIQAISDTKANFDTACSDGNFLYVGDAPTAHAASHAVGGGDSIFPADPGADRYLMWDDDPGELVWASFSGATTALDNLASVAINESLVSDTDNTDALGSAPISWSDLYLGNGSVITWSTAPSTSDVTLTHSANALTFAGGTIALGTATATGGLTGNVTGNCSGQAGTVATITGLAPDTATTQATQPNITTCANLTTVGALDAGSITSNFGAIDNGASAITTTGDITGGGILVTGDTTAGDSAALGYTATEGLILTGQGSTNDVTIKNDADASVINIPTGTRNVTFSGTSSELSITQDWLAGGGNIGVWINMSTDGPSALGSGGAGVDPWVAYAQANAHWFTDSTAGDICYRNTNGRLLFGNTSGAAGMILDSDQLTARVKPRVSTEASSATPTINTDNVDAHSITALATDITSMTTNLSGTPTDFQKLMIRILDNGTARGITWGASFQDMGVALPTTTVISKVLTVGFIYDTADSKWGCVSVAQEL